MNLRPIAFGILLATFIAVPAHAQDQAAPPAPPASPAQKPQRIRGGPVIAAELIHHVQPVYPPDAKAAHVTGTVVLHAIIAKDGSVKDIQLVSGPPMLVQAAKDAVSQWIYKPTTLAGEPMEIDTQIKVVFTLGSPASNQDQDQNQSSPDAAPTAPIDPQLRADILQLFDVIHLKQKAADMGRISFQILEAHIAVDASGNS